MELFGAFLKLGPLLLLKLIAKRDFGPWGAEEAGSWRYTQLWTAGIVLSVAAGGVVSLLVLSEVLAITAFTRGIVVVAACLSLVLLAVHMVWGIAVMYRRHRGSR